MTDDIPFVRYKLRNKTADLEINWADVYLKMEC